MIIIQNIDDNECFKWCLIRYLNLVNHHPARITKSDKDFPKKLDFKELKFPVKVRDIHKNEKKNYIGVSVLVMKIKKKHRIYVSKNVVKKNMLIYY